MMDELTPFEQRETKYNLIFRIAEVVVCSVCLIIFIVLICLYALFMYVWAPIVIIAALTTLIVIASGILMIRLRKRKNKYHKYWLFIAFALMICYLVCVALLVIQILVAHTFLLYTCLGFAALAALIFLLDFIYNLSILIMRRKNKTRKNQVMPENVVAVQISEEKLPPTTTTTTTNEVCGTIECSVIVGDQLACNQQLCHVKWSGDKASTPTAKLIYVQPCNSSVITKACPACKNYNCDKCFRKETNEADITPATESQSVVQSTQFPEDDEPICPLCNFKAVKVYKSEYVQTSNEAIPDDPVLKPIPENIITSMEEPLHSENKVIQSLPVTPRTTLDGLMTCPKCRRGSKVMRKLKKSHVCPLCNQECRSKTTCTSCYYTASATPTEEKSKESKKSTATQTNVSPANIEESRPSGPVNEMTQVSPEDFGEEHFAKKCYEDKMIQVSSKEVVPYKHRKCYVCHEKEPSSKVELRETETQVSLSDFMEGPSVHFRLYRNNPEEYKATNISSKELIGEIATLRHNGAEKIFENKSFGDSVSESVCNESTQITDRDFRGQESPSEEYIQMEFESPPISPKIDQLTQVSSSDFVQKDRRPCGAPNCQHPKCSKYNKTEQVQTMRQVMPEKETFEQFVQTEQEITTTTQGTSTTEIGTSTTKIGTSTTEKGTSTTEKGTSTTKIGTSTIEIGTSTTEKGTSTTKIGTLTTEIGTSTTEIATATTITDQGQSLEENNVETISPSPKNERNQLENDEIKECIDPNCTCVINEKEILICMYCQSVLNKSIQVSTATIDEEISRNIGNIDIPLKSDCKCNLPNCICCKVNAQVQSSKNDCFCIKTNKGLLKCTLCEIMYQEKTGIEEAANLPICSSSVSTCLLYKGRKQEPDENRKLYITQDAQENIEYSIQKTGYTEEMKHVRIDSEDEEQKNKSLKTTEENKKDVKDDDYYASSISKTCSNDSENKVLDSKYLTATEIKTLCTKEREEMSRYLIKKDAERSSAPPPEPPINVTVFTVQKRIDDDIQEKMKSEWDTLADKRATYESRMRKHVESNIKFDDDKMKILERTESTMQTIYNSMIENLLKRQSQKENNLMFLEIIKCGCDSDADAEFSKHQVSNLSGRKEEETSKHSPENNNENDDDILLDIKETNIITPSSSLSSPSSSSEIIIMSENVSLSSITEEVSCTPSDLISSSKESKQPTSPELEKKHDQVDLNATYCIKMTKNIDCQQEVKNRCNQSCKRNTVFVRKLQTDRPEAENTPKNIVQSARCRNISAKVCSARSEKCPRKSAGYFEPFLFSPMQGLTKTSVTTSDNESTIDLIPQDNIETVRSNTSRYLSYHLQEDPIPKEKSRQSQSVPITSRSTDIKQDVQNVYYFKNSMPCTPIKLHWQDVKSNSLTDVSETSTKKGGKETYRKESDYDETISIKNIYLDSDGNEFEMEPKIVPPLLDINITPEHSESEESRPISCSSHFSATTSQTIDNYNLEYRSSLNENPKYICPQETKQSRESLLGTKSQSLSTRTHATETAEKVLTRKHKVKFNIEPVIRDRVRSAPPRTCHQSKKESLNLKLMKSILLTNVSETSTKNEGKETYRNESDYDEDESDSMVVVKKNCPETDGNDFEMLPKIVIPLLDVNITPELSDSEESGPISCSSHFSATTLQTIDNYNLEYSSSLNKNPKYICLQETKSRRSLLGRKFQSLSTRTQSTETARNHEVKIFVEPVRREKRISVQPKTSSQRKKALLSPKSATPRASRQKATTSAANSYKSMEKRHNSSKKSKIKSVPVSPERGYVCHCEFYKKSRNNYCRIHGIGAPQTHTSNLSGLLSSNKKKGANSPKSAKRTRPSTPNIKTVTKSDET